MIHQYINQHIADNNPNEKQVITTVNWMLYGRWIKCEFGRKREIVGTSQSQILTFCCQGLLFDVMLN